MENYNITFKVIASLDNEYTDYISKQTQRARELNKPRKLAKPSNLHFPARIAENGF